VYLVRVVPVGWHDELELELGELSWSLAEGNIESECLVQMLVCAPG
jgi:hypothetical protein